jgi:hypothetical protein
MSRCGCGSTVCSCAVAGGLGISVTGNGSASTPYIITLNLDTGDGAACTEVMACVGSNLGPGLEFVDNTLSVDISSDTGNMTDFGSDDGIYTQATVVSGGTAVTVTGNGTPTNPYVINSAAEVGDTAIQAGDGIVVDGAGVTADPYVISATPSYAQAALTEPLTLTATGRHLAPIAPAATTSILPGGDVIDNGDGTVTLQRAGTYYLSVSCRYEAGASGPGCVYIFLMAGGSSRAWGGMTVPVTTSKYTLGYTMSAMYSTDVPAVVRLDGQRTTNVRTARLTVADVAITRLGPPFAVPALTAPESEPLDPDALDF